MGLRSAADRTKSDNLPRVHNNWVMGYSQAHPARSPTPDTDQGPDDGPWPNRGAAVAADHYGKEIGGTTNFPEEPLFTCARGIDSSPGKQLWSTASSSLDSESDCRPQCMGDDWWRSVTGRRDTVERRRTRTNIHDVRRHHGQLSHLSGTDRPGVENLRANEAIATLGRQGHSGSWSLLMMSCSGGGGNARSASTVPDGDQYPILSCIPKGRDGRAEARGVSCTLPVLQPT